MYDNAENTSMERVVSLLNLVKITNATPKNGNILYRCPICGDSTHINHGHLYIDFNNNKYYCAKCGEGGKSISLYAKYYGIDNKSAFKELIEKDISKKERKKIHNIEKIKKEVKENKNKEVKKLAGIKRRNSVYGALLKKLTLSTVHESDLLKRGLSLEFIKYIGYKSIPQQETIRENIAYELIKEGYSLTGIPGFYKNDRNNWTFKGYKGYLVPAFDNLHRIQGFQIRRFVEKGKYIWFTSSGEMQGISTEAFVNLTKFDVNKKFIIVEGILKSQICSYFNPTNNYIGIPGTFAIEYLIAELIENNIPKVYLALDMDKITNPYVLKAEKKLIDTLQSIKVEYEVITWDLNKGKGLDDYMFNMQLLKSKPQIGEFSYCC